MNTPAKIRHTVRLLGWSRAAHLAISVLLGRHPARLWNHDPDFLALYRQIENHTLVDKARLYMLYQLAGQARGIPGEAAEVGVYKGGTARLISRVLADTPKRVHIFDTFAGMPSSVRPMDFVRTGDFADTSAERVGQYLKDCHNVEIHPGFFPGTAAPVADARFAFAHLDADSYQSIHDCCEFFYPRLEKGGILIVDDYGSSICQGVRPAVDQFFADKPERPCYLPTGQCVVFRI